MPDYKFIGDSPEAILGDTLWQPGETRTVSDALAAELDKNANWTAVTSPVPAAPAPTVAAAEDVTPAPAAVATPDQPPLGG